MNFRTDSSSLPKPIFFLSRYKVCLTEVSLTHMILAKMLVEKLKRNKMVRDVEGRCNNRETGKSVRPFCAKDLPVF